MDKQNGIGCGIHDSIRTQFNRLGRLNKKYRKMLIKTLRCINSNMELMKTKSKVNAPARSRRKIRKNLTYSHTK